MGHSEISCAKGVRKIHVEFMDKYSLIAALLDIVKLKSGPEHTMFLCGGERGHNVCQRARWEGLNI